MRGVWTASFKATVARIVVGETEECGRLGAMDGTEGSGGLEDFHSWEQRKLS